MKTPIDITVRNPYTIANGSGGVLVGLLVFKTSVPVTSWRVGSIPMHFRHYPKSCGGGFGGGFSNLSIAFRTLPLIACK